MSAAQTPAAPRPKHILELSQQEKLDFFNSFDRVFSDIDGVVWNFDNDIVGAPEAYQALIDAGKKLQFITNNSVRPMQVYKKKFNAANLEVDVQSIIHPAKSVVDYLRSINFQGLIYVIASDMFTSYLRDADFDVIDGPTEIIEESVTALGQRVFRGEPVRAVVVDIDFNLSSTKLIKAHIFLRHPECILIAGATDLIVPVRRDINILGPGHFCNILRDASKKEMITLGKPGKELAELTTKRFNIQKPKRTIMVGDMMEQDVGLGKRCGFQTLLVLSGACAKEDLDAETDPQHIPDYYAHSMADFLELIQQINKSNV